MTQVHPVVCWTIDDGASPGAGPTGAGPTGAVVGVLAGEGLWLAGADDRAVTTGLAAELPNHEQVTPVREARLERFTVSVRPTWTRGARRQAAATPVPLPVDAVICGTASGWLVHLPRLDRSFGCVDPAAIPTLVAEEVIHWAREVTPTQVLAELRIGPGRLVELAARRVRDPESRPGTRVLPPVLLRVAEPEPRKRKDRLDLGAWGRTAEVDAVAAAIVAGRNVVVLGDPGVGKSTVLRDAIAKAAALQPTRTFWRTTVHRLIAGARYLGEWQEKADEVAIALQSCEGALWIEDLLAWFTRGDAPTDAIAAYWRRPLLEGAFTVIGELAPRGWDVVRTALPDVARLFEVVAIGELGVEATREVVDRLAGLAAGPIGVTVAPEARRRAIRLLDRFDRYQRFPGKAVRLIRSLVEEADRAGRSTVTDAEVIAGFGRSTGLPPALVDDAVPLTAAEIEAALGETIHGQPDALASLARVLLCWKAGLNDPDRPVATLLFAGPTGVGKTASTLALARFCFGAGSDGRPGPALVRIDMSELGSPWQVERLLGTRREAGTLVRQVRERPFSVVLLDEVEKAHPLFFDLLLGVLDEGRLVDALGRETDFRASLIVMTTNLGTRAGSSLGFGDGGPAMDPGAIRSFFRPEFVNRLDEIVRFRPLDREAVRGIARRALAAIPDREGLRGRGIGLRFTEAVVDRVVAGGFDPMFGARPLHRAIEHEVVAAIARELVATDAVAIDFLVDVDGDRITVT
ncbi:MAG: AAA family ATPase [Myxococcota bacterium]